MKIDNAHKTKHDSFQLPKTNNHTEQIHNSINRNHKNEFIDLNIDSKVTEHAEYP